MALGIGAASAADLGVVHGGHAHFVAHYDPIGRPAGQLYIYDWEPGVVVRAYWLPPSRDRHYLPFGHDRWDVHPVRSRPVRPVPAEPFYRFWGASSAFDPPPNWPAPASRVEAHPTIHDK